MILNFDTIKDIVILDRKKKIYSKELKFIRDKDFNIRTDITEKVYGVVYDKRVLNEDLTTEPYGFIKN